MARLQTAVAENREFEQRGIHVANTREFRGKSATIAFDGGLGQPPQGLGRHYATLPTSPAQKMP